MTVVDESVGDGLAAAVDEAGTAPEDRRFRPDVEGLRAVAIVLVVLFHAGVPGISGGFVGVDVFFVISGFVITGVLLREQASSRRVSMLGFYGRRARRIIPAATVAIIVTVTATYLVLGVIAGNQTAIDGRWAALFLANFHFASVGTNYLTAQLPPSPLQNFWSLAVEEQFYLVYPTIFVVIAALRTKLSLQARLAIGLITVIAASFALSVTQTSSNPSAAFFSPFTRAWELALGALVAVGTKWLLGIPKSIGSVLTWTGLAAIVFGSVAFDSRSPYPGALVAVPVIGTALVIAGGMTAPRQGAESLLRLPPFRWLGRISYSLYLWHWPILILAAEAAGKTSLPFRQNVVWLLVALGASMASYYVVENPIRHARLPFAGRWAAVILGALLIATSVGVVSVQLDAHAAPGPVAHAALVPPGAQSGATGAVTQALEAVPNAVREAPQIRTVPADLTPSFTQLGYDWGGPPDPCWPATGQTSVPACVFGDPAGTHTMVLYGDSHAGMWFAAMNDIATKAHWKLVYLGKGYCPAATLPFENPGGWGKAGGEYAVCDQWHRFAVNRINHIKPDLVVITQERRSKVDGADYSPAEWKHGLMRTLQQLAVPAKNIVVLGNLPVLGHFEPQCLVAHQKDVQACSNKVFPYQASYISAERGAAASVGARYADITSWFCSATCTPVIGKYQVYWDSWHITASYSFFLEPLLIQALGLPEAA
ncbi:MAG TPA: acyltransferase family protein [Acidimicrobiales bacterium]|nr:acyltransferase family protein [Acidimicrobiales bacterium]